MDIKQPYYYYLPEKAIFGINIPPNPFIMNPIPYFITKCGIGYYFYIHL